MKNMIHVSTIDIFVRGTYTNGVNIYARLATAHKDATFH